jgi:hypothetical protein
MTSQYLNRTQLRGLQRVGDALIPGDRDFPSFSRARCIEQGDRMFAYMSPSDLSGVRVLLGVFAFLPRMVLRGLFALTDRQAAFPAPIGAVLRMINIGIKGVVMSLYYSDVGAEPSIYRLIGWDAKVVERDPGEHS